MLREKFLKASLKKHNRYFYNHEENQRHDGGDRDLRLKYSKCAMNTNVQKQEILITVALLRTYYISSSGGS